MPLRRPAALLARRPLVAKLVSDPAYERAQRYRLFGGHAGGVPACTLAALCGCCSACATLRSAAQSRSSFRAPILAEIAAGWGLDPSRIHVLTNPAPPPRDVDAGAAAAGDLRLRRAADGAQKALGTAIEAFAQVPEARLVVVGDGPERASSRRTRPVLRERNGSSSAARARATMRSRSSPARTLRLLSSDWENLPHSAVEALSVGVPVVATSVGGVPEVVP